MFREGDRFPGDEHRDRIARYEQHRLMIRGLCDAGLQAEMALQGLADTDYLRDLTRKVVEDIASDIRIVVNLPKVIAKKHAGMAARGLTVTAGSDESTGKIEDALAASSQNTLIRKAFWRAKVYGNAVLTPRRLDDESVIVDARDPWTWFPEVDPFNSSVALAHVFAWVVARGDDEYLLQERHEAGKIERTAHHVRSVSGNAPSKAVREVQVGSQVDWATVVGEDAPAESEDTGIDEPMVVSLRSWTDGEVVYGEALQSGNESLVAEITARLSHIATVLDKHSDPKLTGPRDALKKNASGEPYFNVRDSYYPVEDGEVGYAYLTWEAQLEHSHQELERVISLLCVQMEMAPELLGLNLSRGAGVEATDTLRIRAYNTLSAVEDDRAFYADGLMTLGRIILKLTGEEKPDQVTVAFGDALPLSKKETAELVGTQLVAGTISLETAVRKQNPEMSKDEVKTELERIRRDALALDIETPGQG